MRKALKLFSVLLLTLFLSSGLFSNGFNLNGSGSKAISMGGAFIGLADDYSAVFWNPAGLSQLKGSNFSVFGTFLMPKSTYKSNLYGIDATTESKLYPSGAMGYFKSISDKLTIGLAAYVPSGLGVKWNGDDFSVLTQGTSLEWESFLAVVSISPVVSYKISEKFSIGATININYAMLDVKNPGIGQYHEDLNGLCMGATIGALFKPCDKFSIGFTFRTPSKVTLDGDIEMKGAELYGVSGTTEGERELTWPMWVGAGIAFKATDKLTITADVQYTDWKKIDVIEMNYTDAQWQAMKAHPLLGAAFNKDFNFYWDSKVQLRVGAEYLVSNSFAIRAGYYYDPAPSAIEHINILMPSITYDVITFGWAYRTDKISLDFCLEYLMGKNREAAAGIEGVLPGTYDLDIFVPNFGFTYRF